MEPADQMINETTGNEEESGSIIILFEGLSEIWLPDGFIEMNPEQEAVRFPYRQKPPVIRTDRTGSYVVTFQLYNKPLASDQTVAAVRSLAKLINKEYPNNHKIPVSSFRTNQDIGGGWFRFCHVAGEKSQQCDFFVLPIHNRLFVGTMSYPEPDKDKWNPFSSKIRTMVTEISSKGRRNVR